MAIRFIVDTASDILPQEAEKWGVKLLPMTIRFGDEEYRDAYDLSHRAFYEKLIESDTLPTTSQISPAVFEDAYAEVTENGDTAVVITLSSQLSGTYQSAVIAAQDYAGKVFVVDSENVCVGERILLERGMTLAKEGLSAAQIAARLDREKKEIRIMALLDTLEYLKKGGRISSAVAFAGGLLSIKPVVAAVDGKVELIGKARGSKQGNNLLHKLTDENGVDFTRPFCLAYSGLSDHLLQKYIEDNASIWKGRTDTLPITTVGCTIGTHIGPDAIAVAFFSEK